MNPETQKCYSINELKVRHFDTKSHNISPVPPVHELCFYRRRKAIATNQSKRKICSIRSWGYIITFEWAYVCCGCLGNSVLLRLFTLGRTSSWQRVRASRLTWFPLNLFARLFRGEVFRFDETSPSICTHTTCWVWCLSIFVRFGVIKLPFSCGFLEHKTNRLWT